MNSRPRIFTPEIRRQIETLENKKKLHIKSSTSEDLAGFYVESSWSCCGLLRAGILDSCRHFPQKRVFFTMSNGWKYIFPLHKMPSWFHPQIWTWQAAICALVACISWVARAYWHQTGPEIPLETNLKCQVTETKKLLEVDIFQYVQHLKSVSYKRVRQETEILQQFDHGGSKKRWGGI